MWDFCLWFVAKRFTMKGFVVKNISQIVCLTMIGLDDRRWRLLLFTCLACLVCLVLWSCSTGYTERFLWTFGLCVRGTMSAQLLSILSWVVGGDGLYEREERERRRRNRRRHHRQRTRKRSESGMNQSLKEWEEGNIIIMIFSSSSNHLIVLVLSDVVSSLTSCLLVIPWVFRWSLLILFLDPLDWTWKTQSLGPSCKCIFYTETYGKEYGVFTSPNWPAPYEENIDCLLFTFQGASDQLVEVTFDEFDVQRTNEWVVVYCCCPIITTDLKLRQFTQWTPISSHDRLFVLFV